MALHLHFMAAPFLTAFNFSHRNPMSWYLILKLTYTLLQRLKSQYGFLLRAAVWQILPLPFPALLFPLYFEAPLKGEVDPRDWTQDPRILSSPPYPCCHGRLWGIIALTLVLFYLTPLGFAQSIFGCQGAIALLLETCMCHRCSRSCDQFPRSCDQPKWPPPLHRARRQS